MSDPHERSTHRAGFSPASAEDAKRRPNTASASPGESASASPGEGARVTELEAEVAGLEDQLRRALADFDNLRKRLAREVDRARADERARVAAAWLPVVDNLELALAHAGADPSTLIEGIRSVRDQAIAVLERLGYPRHDAVGDHFDPAQHEAVRAIVDADAPPGTVLQVARPGYGTGEQQLRPASVVVSKDG